MIGGITMTATKYQSVYKELSKDGKKTSYYVSVFLGRDPVTGKRIIKKARRDQYGNHFKTARAAYLEAERLKNEYKHGSFPIRQGQATLHEYYSKVFKPTYKGNVEESTWLSREPVFEMILKWFGNKKLTQIQPTDCLQFRNWLLSPEKRLFSGLCVVSLWPFSTIAG